MASYLSSFFKSNSNKTHLDLIFTGIFTRVPFLFFKWIDILIKNYRKKNQRLRLHYYGSRSQYPIRLYNKHGYRLKSVTDTVFMIVTVSYTVTVIVFRERDDNLNKGAAEMITLLR